MTSHKIIWKGNITIRSRFRILFTSSVPLFVLAHFCHHLVTTLPIPLIPMIRDEFGLDYTQSGLVISAFGISYGISQLPGGWLSDRLGARIMITTATCGVAIVGLLIGLSHTYAIMIFFLVLMGIMGGGYHPAASPAVSSLVDTDNRGAALGMHAIGGGLSFFLAPLIAAGIAAFWGWRGSFIVLAVPTMLFGILFYLFWQRITASHKKTDSPTDLRTADQNIPGSRRHLITFVTLSTLTSAITFSVISFIPLFLVDNFGVDEKSAAAFISIVYSAGIWASPIGGYLSDRLGRVVMLIIVCFIAGPTFYLLGIMPFALGTGLIMVIIGTIQYMRMPTTESYIIGHASSHNRSSIMGIYFFLSMEAGSILTPALGYLIDNKGFQFSFTIAGIFVFAVAVVCSLLLRGGRD